MNWIWKKKFEEEKLKYNNFYNNFLDNTNHNTIDYQILLDKLNNLKQDIKTISNNIFNLPNIYEGLVDKIKTKNNIIKNIQQKIDEIKDIEN